MKKVLLNCNKKVGDKLKRVCIVAPDYFPVPAVKGGAVEILIQNILDENEKEKKLDIVCITRYDKKAGKLYSNYKHTEFFPIRMINRNSILGTLLAVFNYGIKRIFKYDIRLNYRKSKYEKAIIKANADIVVFESENSIFDMRYTEIVGKNKMVMHLHKTYEPQAEWEKMFQNFIAISNYVKNRFISDGTISEDRVSVVYNGIDIAKFDKKVLPGDIKSIKKKYNIPDNKKIIIYTGRLIEVKGVKELIEAFKICKNKDNAYLVICGGGFSNNNDTSEYIKEIKELSKGENIVFTGFLDNQELYKYYSMSSFAVFPSLWEEGFGNVVIEAMLSKIPVIISKRGGMQELVSENTGISVELDAEFVNNLSKAIDKLLSDDKLRKQLGKNAYTFAKDFSKENYYKNYCSVIKKLFEEKNG